ncbi:UNVERIFIED_ORG: hypothetical protein [Escherichia phage CMSTMSU]
MYVEEGCFEEKQSVHFSTGKDNWTTPKDFFEDLDELWEFTLDAACVKETALCDKFFTPEDNSLEQDWETISCGSTHRTVI